MKFKVLSTIVLTSTLLGGFSTVASAAPDQLDSTGTVEVQEGTSGGSSTETVDPEKPGSVLPTPDTDSPKENTNPDTGALIIEKTTDLNFGTVKTSANEVTQFAQPMKFNSGADKRGSYIQWSDVRSGGTFGYTITAQLTQQFTDASSNKLSGSTIDFSNGAANPQSGNTNTVPSNVTTAFQLTEAANDAKTVVVADKTKQEGKGRFIMAFGQSSASTESNSVKLTIPAATASNMVKGTYTAKVTWKIVAAP